MANSISNSNRYSFREIHVIQLFTAILLLILAVLFMGTGDDGDSLLHFMYAKWAYTDPSLFFNHWAKPLFVLAATPWSQFGFVGIKIFNIVNILLAQYFIYRVCLAWDYKFPWLASLFLILCPMLIYFGLSGLTEPFFACLFSLGLFLLQKEKFLSATILISFLPFARSEGLIIIILCAAYLLWIKKYSFLPWLLTGHVIYGFAGMRFYNNDFLWPFNKIPYPINKAFYGKGELFHFVYNMPYVTGIILSALLLVGCFFLFRDTKKLLQSRNNSRLSLEVFLIYGSFLGFLFFHSYAWAFGRFNSFGLMRVFIAVIPMMCIIMTKPFEYWHTFFESKKGLYTLAGIISFQFILNFTPNHNYAVQARKLNETGAQICMKKAISELEEKYPEWTRLHKIYAAVSFPFYAKLNPFVIGLNENIGILNQKKSFPENTLIVWDEWFAQLEGGVKEERITTDTTFNKFVITEFTGESGDHHKVIMARSKIDKSMREIREEKIRSMMHTIRSDEKWLSHVREKAIERGVPLDSMIYLDAEYMIDIK